MDENRNKRKDLIKNIAIIFLAVLLVLTFLSDTIMNYSLPEVAAQYCSSGSITNKLRGSGYVEAQDPYKVVFKQTRKVDSVVVHVGDQVEKGQVLYKLEAGESDELKGAKEALKAAKDAYEKYIIEHQISTNISNAVQDGSAGTLEKNQTAITTAENVRDARQKAYDAAVKEYDQFDNGTAANFAEYKNLDDLQSALDAWTRQLSITSADWADLSETDKDALDYWMKQYNISIETMNTVAPLLTQAKIKYDAAKQNYETYPDDTSIQDAYNAAKTEYDALSDQYADADADRKAAEEAMKTNPIKPIKDKYDAYNNAKMKVPEYQGLVSAAEKVIKDKKEELNYKRTIASEELKKAETNLNDLLENINAKYAVADLVKSIQEAEDKVKEIEEGDAGIVDITAPVTGTIISMNYVAGETIDTGSTVATIQVAGKGYTMSLTVPNEKAALVNLGDEAEISNSWWYVDVHARVSSIKPDPSNPSKQKIITFELEGDVSSGQSLSVTVGQRTSNYDCIVPTSAIREDNEGKFVMRINAKSTPLGNRYIAERINVKVLAEDETRSAISGDLEGWDYIITTASKPVDDGQQVRLKD